MDLIRQRDRVDTPPRGDSSSLGRGGLRARGVGPTALAALVLGMALAAAPEAVAKTPAPWTGTITKWSDADTLFVMRGDEPQKVRLHWADAPEVAHTKNDVGQAAGVAALEWAAKQWPVGTTVHVKPKGSMSYDRVVADVDCDGVELGLAEVRAGFAWVDARYKPPAEWTKAQADATAKSRGLWNESKFGKATAPWVWRAKKRNARYE